MTIRIKYTSIFVLGRTYICLIVFRGSVAFRAICKLEAQRKTGLSRDENNDENQETMAFGHESNNFERPDINV